MSCPEAVPSQKNGARIASAVANETTPAFIQARGPSTFCRSSRVAGLSVMLRLSLLQLIRQIDYLPHVVVRVSGRTQKNTESLFRLRLALRRIFLQPVGGFLLSNRLHNHRYRKVKRREDFFLWKRLWLCEFPITVAHIAGSCHSRADVIIQISGEMKNQMADAISARIRFAPELFRRQ